MKRTLVVITTLILIVGLFSNVALAEASQAEVVLAGGSNISLNSELTTTTLNGYIMSVETSAIIDSNNKINIVKDKNNNGLLDTDEMNAEDVLYSIDATGGQFSIVITPSVSGRFFVYGQSNDTASFDNAGTSSLAYSTYKVLPSMELKSPDMLMWAYPVEGQKIVSGSFLDNNSDIINKSELTINYINDNNTMGVKIAEPTMVDSSNFGFMVSGSYDLGKIGLFYKSILAFEGEIVNRPEVDILNNLPNHQQNQNITIDVNIENKLEAYNTVNCYLNGEKTIVNIEDNGVAHWQVTLNEGINFIYIKYAEETKFQSTFNDTLYYNCDFMKSVPGYNNDSQKYNGKVSLQLYKSNDLPDVQELRAELYTVNSKYEEVNLSKNLVLTNENNVFKSEQFEASKYDYYYIKLYNNNDLIKHYTTEVYPTVVITSDCQTQNQHHTVTGYLAYADDFTKFEYKLDGQDAVTVTNIDNNGNFSFEVDLQPNSNFIDTYIYSNDGRFGNGFSVRLESVDSRIRWNGPNSSHQDNQNIIIEGYVENKVGGLNQIVATINDSEQIVELNDNGDFSINVSLLEGYNFVKLEYKDDTNIYADYEREFFYNTIFFKKEYLYDNVNQQFSGTIKLKFNCSHVNCNEPQLRAELYEIENHQLNYIEDITIAKNNDKYEVEYNPIKSKQFYLKIYNQSNSLIGYLTFSSNKSVVLTSGYEVNETPTTLSGYLAFADDFDKLEFKVNNGELVEVTDIDNKGNFSVGLNLQQGQNNIKAYITVGQHQAISGFSIMCTVAGDDLSITTESLPYAIVGKEYSFTLQAIGGTEPYQWSSLTPAPHGMSFNNGTLAGTPTNAGDYNITILVQDATSKIVEKDYVISIKEAAVRPTLSIANIVTIPNAIAEVPVTLKDANGITALQYELRYNGDVIEFSSFEAGNMLNDWTITTNVVEKGVLRIALVNTSGLSQSEVNLGSLKFKVLGEIGTTSSLIIKSPFATDALLSDIVPRVKHGKVEVFVSYGDVNGDSKINVVDVVRIMQHVNNSKPLNGADLMAGDVNGDNTVNQADISLVMNHIVKEISKFPVVS
ncbi:hypothetical protein IMX26_11240 [Clostridium sp. 'deep sea']|uniref:dockerin type I domain-containing protein n=1 Tax=Clostridium sp. 'deep sea' TaxID=2779445 RepID=UPI00189692FE|nr:dockerin type I domain-containing protein [Clostridium sp. 'deep sea']QOR34065.1 hypothetical protein IMX26_11240 [Clostridium sp. 'deep sea']